LTTNRTPPDDAEALVSRALARFRPTTPAGDLASQPDFSSFDGNYTLIGMGNERVRLQLLADGAVTWSDRATHSTTPPRCACGSGAPAPGIDITTATR
jgi:hypothetical protein